MGDNIAVAPETWRVLSSYYDFRVQYAGKRQPKRTPKKAPEFAARYVEWAHAKQIDPVLFMRTAFERFAAARPGASPHLSSMRSEKLLLAWQRDEGRVLEQESFRRLKRVARTPREREIRALKERPKKRQEAARSDYRAAGRFELCVLDETTGGYDPRSRVCPNCPHKYACLLGTNRRHGFDVGALRVGVFDRLPPDVAAIARGSRDA